MFRILAVASLRFRHGTPAPCMNDLELLKKRYAKLTPEQRADFFEELNAQRENYIEKLKFSIELLKSFLNDLSSQSSIKLSRSTSAPPRRHSRSRYWKN
jgi:hypothetical protein